MTAATLPQKLSAFAADIKLSHSVFALPFALLATCLAAVRSGGLHVGQVLLILLCMVAARTTAMGANRYFDARLDALNPRTKGRAIPSGTLSSRFVVTAIIFNAALFLLGSVGFGVFFDNWLPAILALPVIALLCAYPLFKRFSALCHYYLGLALAIAPPCAEIAIAGSVTLPVLLIAVGVLCWTAGFDIIYATVDRGSDVETGVHSVPAAVGIGRALLISRATHVASVAAFVGGGLVSAELSTLYFIAVAIAAVLLIVEQSLVKPNDLSKVGLAFFTVNGVISLVVGTLGIIDVYVG
ncbi:MAG: 4-hydroxybenzoate octaprenyltransferase [Planctomycetota bacterium]